MYRRVALETLGLQDTAGDLERQCGQVGASILGLGVLWYIPQYSTYLGRLLDYQYLNRRILTQYVVIRMICLLEL